MYQSDESYLREMVGNWYRHLAQYSGCCNDLLEFTGMTADEYAAWVTEDVIPARVMRVANRHPGHYVPGSDRNHFAGRCEECDAHYLIGKTWDEVHNWYVQGIVGQDAWEAYAHVWATSADRFSSVGAGYETEPDPEQFPVVVRMVAIMRKALAARKAG